MRTTPRKNDVANNKDNPKMNIISKMRRTSENYDDPKYETNPAVQQINGLTVIFS